MDGEGDTTAFNNKQYLSHKKWKALKKKLKRKSKRKAAALERCEAEKQDEEAKSLSPTYIAKMVEEEKRAIYEEERLELERKRNHILWVEREHRALVAVAAKKEWERREKQRQEEEEQRIREEWEEQQRKDKEEEERMKKEEEEKKNKEDQRKRKQADLLKEATANEKTSDDETWHNPIAPVTHQDENVVHCPFFQRTGACRFGERCSRAHMKPESSTTILIPGMYSHYELEQSLLDEYDTDLSLEYEESELYRSFVEFYDDVLPEFRDIGRVIQFKVCCNHEPHLRGNVYIQYNREEDAQNAFLKFNGRWYAGKQLSCEFSAVKKWQLAICGLFHKKKCPKGKNCNFLHVFKNPRNEFWEADRDYYDTQRSHRADSIRSWSVRSRRSRSRSRSRLRSSNHSHRRSRSRSYSPHYKRRRRRRSQSRSKGHRSRSRSRSRNDRYRSRDSPSGTKNRRSRHSRSPRTNRDASRSKSTSQSHAEQKSIADQSKSKNNETPTSVLLDNILTKEKDISVTVKPISFTIKPKEPITQNKDRLLIWKEVDQDSNHSDIADTFEKTESLSPNSENEEINTSSKKHKHGKKGKNKKSKKHKSLSKEKREDNKREAELQVIKTDT